MSTVDYHLKELNIALDAEDPRRALPELGAGDQVVLDIGCGIGQSLLALQNPHCRRIGIDVDHEAIRYGRDVFGHELELHVAPAERLPVADQSCDLVFSRVALPYTHIPRALREMRRVLKPGGRVWITLHNRSVAGEYWHGALETLNLKRLLHVLYILLNGYMLKYLGLLLPFVNGHYESWQDIETMTRLLEQLHFEVRSEQRGRHTIVEATLPADADADAEP